MATAYIRVGGAMGGGAPVYSAKPRWTEDLDAATVATTTQTAQAGDYLRIVASGGAIRVAISANPTASATSGDIVLDGQAVDFGPLAQGDKVSVIDV